MEYIIDYPMIEVYPNPKDIDSLYERVKAMNKVKVSVLESNTIVRSVSINESN